MCIRDSLSSVQKTVDDVQPVIQNVNQLVEEAKPLIDNVNDAVTSARPAVAQLDPVLAQAADALGKVDLILGDASKISKTAGQATTAVGDAAESIASKARSLFSRGRAGARAAMPAAGGTASEADASPEITYDEPAPKPEAVSEEAGYFTYPSSVSSEGAAVELEPGKTE